jgi:hypothetical protein
MDDLTFRKTIYANPYTTDPAVIEAAAKDSKKQAFWNEIKLMENQLKAAMDIPVPENLAEKLILRQSLSSYKSASHKRPWYLGLAAAVAFASVLSIGVLKTGNGKLSEDIFAHMSHTTFEVMSASNVSIEAINDKLASFNGHMNGNIGEVLSANYCYLDEIKSLHMIIRGESGITSLFVMPDSISESISDSFSNATYHGTSFLLQSAKVIVVGETDADVEQLKQRAIEAMSFSA